MDRTSCSGVDVQPRGVSVSSVDVEAVDGAAAIKTGTLAVVVDYETDAPLG